MASLKEGETQLNIKIPIDLKTELDEKAKEQHTDKSVYITGLLLAGLEQDGYADALTKAGSSQEDLASARMHLDAAFDIVKNVIRQKEEARDTARAQVKIDLDSKNRDIRRLKDEADAAKEAEAKIRSLSEKNAASFMDAQREIEDLKAQIAEKTKECDTLRSSINDKEELLNNMRDKYKEYDSRLKEYEQVEKELDRLEEALIDKTNKAETLEKENSSLSTQLKAANDRQKQLESTVESLKGKKDELNAKVTELTAKADHIPELKDEIKHLKEENEQLVKLSAKADLVPDLKQEIQDLKIKIDKERDKAVEDTNARWESLIRKLGMKDSASELLDGTAN